MSTNAAIGGFIFSCGGLGNDESSLSRLVFRIALLWPESLFIRLYKSSDAKVHQVRSGQSGGSAWLIKKDDGNIHLLADPWCKGCTVNRIEIISICMLVGIG